MKRFIDWNNKEKRTVSIKSHFRKGKMVRSYIQMRKMRHPFAPRNIKIGDVLYMHGKQQNEKHLVVGFSEYGPIMKDEDGKTWEPGSPTTLFSTKPLPLKINHREHLPFSDTKGKKYIRFGNVPKSGKSRVGNAPNWFFWGQEGQELAGVSVVPVKFNKKRNLWQIDDDNLAEGGYASVDELLANQDEWEDQFVGGGHQDDPKTGKHSWSPPQYKWVQNKNRRPIYLVTGEEIDEEGTDGEPLLKNVKILDRLNVWDVFHDGYFDPDEDIDALRIPSAFQGKKK